MENLTTESLFLRCLSADGISDSVVKFSIAYPFKKSRGDAEVMFAYLLFLSFGIQIMAKKYEPLARLLSTFEIHVLVYLYHSNN